MPCSSSSTPAPRPPTCTTPPSPSTACWSTRWRISGVPAGDTQAQRLFALNQFLIERRRAGQDRPHHRRGPEPVAGDPRAGAPLVQLRDADREAPADPARRPARAGRSSSSPSSGSSSSGSGSAAPSRRSPRMRRASTSGSGCTSRVPATSTSSPTGRSPDRRLRGWHPPGREHALRPLPPDGLRGPGAPDRPKDRRRGHPLSRRRGADAGLDRGRVDRPAGLRQPRWALGVLGVLLATGGLALTLHLNATSDWSYVLNRVIDGARAARDYLVP